MGGWGGKVHVVQQHQEPKGLARQGLEQAGQGGRVAWVRQDEPGGGELMEQGEHIGGFPRAGAPVEQDVFAGFPPQKADGVFHEPHPFPLVQAGGDQGGKGGFRQGGQASVRLQPEAPVLQKGAASIAGEEIIQVLCELAPILCGEQAKVNFL